jgi:hypothetical protein
MSPVTKNLEHAGNLLTFAAAVLSLGLIISGYFFYQTIETNDLNEILHCYKLIAIVSFLSLFIFIIAIYGAGRCLQDSNYS